MRVEPGTRCQFCASEAQRAWPWPDGSFALPLCRRHWPHYGRKDVSADPMQYYTVGSTNRKKTERREGRDDW